MTSQNTDMLGIMKLNLKGTDFSSASRIASVTSKSSPSEACNCVMVVPQFPLGIMGFANRRLAL